MRLFLFSILAFGSLTTSVVAQQFPTIFLAGDSTMAAKAANKRPETGWGEMLEKHLKPGTVKVDNRAINGRSTKSFIDEGRWQLIVDSLKKGDFVLVQFGHNDQKADKPAVYASPEAYKANLVKFIKETREKGGTPVLMTSVRRRKYDDKGLVDTHGVYPELVKTVGREQGVEVIDMHRMNDAVFIKYGREGSTKLFLHLKPGENPNYPNGVEDNTHFSTLGADEIANLAVIGIKELKLRGLTKYLK